MRDWVIIATPLGLVVYFLLFPGHYHDLVAWLLRVL